LTKLEGDENNKEKIQSIFILHNIHTILEWGLCLTPTVYSKFFFERICTEAIAGRGDNYRTYFSQRLMVVKPRPTPPVLSLKLTSFAAGAKLDNLLEFTY